MNKRCRQVPSPYPYFIAPFQFVDKVTWRIDVDTLLIVNASMHVINIVHDSSNVHCASFLWQKRPVEWVYSVLWCSEHTCCGVIAIAFVQLDIFKFHCCIWGKIIEVRFQICMESNNIVSITICKNKNQNAYCDVWIQMLKLYNLLHFKQADNVIYLASAPILFFCMHFWTHWCRRWTGREMLFVHTKWKHTGIRGTKFEHRQA